MSKPSAKEMDRLKATIDREVVRWKSIMGLGPWVIATVYRRDDSSLPKRYAKQAKIGYGALMWVQVNWEYLDATINVCLHRVHGRTEEELADDVRHELAHIVVNEMREGATAPAKLAAKHEERVVTILAHAFRQAHVAGWNEGRAHLKKQWAKDRKKGSKADAPASRGAKE